jgi:hypothetical protein
MANIITPQEVGKNTALGGNVDVSKYAYMIPDQQTFILEPTLGTALLEKILLDITTSGIDSLTGHYQKIVFDYCKPILWNSVFAEFLLFADMQVDNNGVFNVLPSDSQLAAERSVTRRVSAINSKAQYYIDRLEEYLCDKGNEIPEYRDAQPNNYDIDVVKSNSIVGGIYLKDYPDNKPWFLQDVGFGK